MPNAKDLIQSRWPSILLVGESGTHKTFFLGTCPKPVIFDFDGTMLVLRGKDVEYFRFKEAPKESPAKVIKPELGIYEWGTAYPSFLKTLNDIGAEIDDPDDRKFDTIGLDSLTSLGRVALSYVLKATGYNVTPKSPVDPGTWGFQSGLLQTVCEQVNAWPVIKVMTAHIQRDTNMVTNNVEKLPLTTGKFAALVSTLYDEVYYTETSGIGREQKFVLRTNQDGILKHAKSPCGVPDRTPTDFAEIAKYVLGVGKAA